MLDGFWPKASYLLIFNLNGRIEIKKPLNSNKDSLENLKQDRANKIQITPNKSH